MNIIIKIGLLIISYLIGSIPFGLLIGKMKGLDIRLYGSKNIGSTNVGRVLGRRYAVITYILDMLKGAILVFLFRFEIIPKEYCFLSPMIYGLLACIGHVYSVFVNLRGGKAVATGSGVIFGYAPWLVLLLYATFILVVVLSRYVSLGSILASASALIFTIVLAIIGHDPVLDKAVDWYFPLVTLVMVSLIVFRHKDNINRIKNKTERTIDGDATNNQNNDNK